MSKYRKRPVVIEAVRYFGGNNAEIADFMGCSPLFSVTTSTGGGPINSVHIETLEGTMIASDGDWIIRGVANELYPCKDEIFRATYEAVTP